MSKTDHEKVSQQRRASARKGSLRDLHPQILRGGARPGIQFAAGAARGLRGLYHQPAPRRLGVPAHTGERMTPPTDDASARPRSGGPPPGLGRRGHSNDGPRGADIIAEVDHQIAELGDRSTHELRIAWRQFHRAEPPQGLSRDLMIRGLANQLQERADDGLSRALQRRLQLLTGEFEKGARSFRPGIVLKPGTTLVRQVARALPYRRRARGRVRIRRPALSLAERDCREDHRGTLVGSPVFWREQSGTKAGCAGTRFMMTSGSPARRSIGRRAHPR